MPGPKPFAEDVPSRPQTAILLLALAGGAGVALLMLPRWLPGLSMSMLGSEPKFYWYLSRASAIIAYILLWLSTMLGLSITGKVARLWPGGPAAFDVHQHTSLLGSAFAVFHALILLGDRYTGYTLVQVLVPFTGSYRPLGVALGQAGLYVTAVVIGSFYVRRRIGNRTWRLIHFAGFAIFVLALLHGLVSGTDSSTAWMSAVYWISGSSVLFLTAYRATCPKTARPRETTAAKKSAT
jgi:predicted ferric reductase